ncbi:MAG: FkbM family methyltransferase [Phycisphaeraceae bacterium]
MLKRLAQCNWQTPIIPRRWLRGLYRKAFLKAGQSDGSLPFECDFFGLRYAGDACNVIDFHCFFYGAFEKGHLFFWRDVAGSLFAGQGVYLDIGANVGHHALFMTRHCSAVHAFEPYAPVREKIHEKIRLNRLSNLFVHDVGVGDENITLPFHAPAGANLGVGSFVDGQADRAEASQSLQVVKGDDYFTRAIGGHVQMVKIDVEGFEKNALTGFRETFARERPVMVVELTTGLTCSFDSQDEILATLPEDYLLFRFDLLDKRGRKDKAKSRAFRRQGRYRLAPFDFARVGKQADMIAFPRERFEAFRTQDASPQGRGGGTS